MIKNTISKFTLRVYGLFINESNEIMLTDEFRLGMFMTKFPGGGLEFGEGTIDCLRRECREELHQEIQNICHFYTTDFFQPTSLLSEPHQLISIYYLATLSEPEKLFTSRLRFDIPPVEGAQAFRWVKINDLDEIEITFPIDKKVVALLKDDFQKMSGY